MIQKGALAKWCARFTGFTEPIMRLCGGVFACAPYVNVGTRVFVSVRVKVCGGVFVCTCALENNQCQLEVTRGCH